MNKEQTKTGWKVKHTHKGYECYLENKFESICIDEESALHSIWVMDGKEIDFFYVLKDEIVYLIDRGAL